MDSDKLIDEFLKEDCTYGEFVNQMKALCRQGHPDAVTVVSLLNYLNNRIKENEDIAKSDIINTECDTIKLEVQIRELKTQVDDLVKRVRYLEGWREL